MPLNIDNPDFARLTEGNRSPTPFDEVPLLTREMVSAGMGVLYGPACGTSDQLVQEIFAAMYRARPRP